jgi:two-component system phosphate regulon response regulator PhoB
MITGDRSRVLIVERDPSLRDVVRRHLDTREIAVQDDSGRRDLETLTRDFEPDVVVLELAGYTGTDRLRQVRAVSDAPVIALLDRIVDCVEALEQGADDYLEKPLSPRELVAKITSALRRVRREGAAGRIVRGTLEIDRRAREVRVDGHVVPMPSREFELLSFLAASAGQTFSRTTLLEQVWRASEDWLGSDTVTEHVRRLRHRIEPDPSRPRMLRTVRGVGYRFDDPAGGPETRS